MAGELKGKAYEALVRLILGDLQADGTITEQVFWDQRPNGMTIEPDLTIGPTKDDVSTLLLITHSGAAGNSHMKYWRNMGELAEAKVRLPRLPKAFTIAFDSAIKEDLKSIQAASFDGQLLVGDQLYGKDLRKWIDGNLSKLPKDREEKVDALRASRKSNAKFAELCDSLKNDISALLLKEPAATQSLWIRERKRRSGVPPKPRNTFLRRGVGKLLLVDNIGLIDVGGLRFEKAAPKVVTEAFLALEFAQRTISGVAIVDEEIKWALANLEKPSLSALHQFRAATRISEWISALISLAAVRPQLEYLESNWAAIVTPEGMLAALTECKRTPWKIAPQLIPKNSKRVWLFHMIVEWIKLSGARRASYGLGRLIEDIEQATFDGRHRKVVATLLGRSPIWNAKRSVELGLTDWHSSPSKQRFLFAPDDLARVAAVLAGELSKCQPPNARKDISRVVEAFIQTTLEAKLLTYRGFSPIEHLLRSSLRAAKIPFTCKALRSCFAQQAECLGAVLDPRSGGTAVLIANKTIINWQSAHGSHTNDKKKELCGRAVALRYAWDASSNGFISRPGIEKLILILDGTWKQADLDALIATGWDEIFYPDEMDKLAGAIV